MSKLVSTFLRSVKPKDKVQKYFDGGGLYLYVTTKGAKLWRIDYRYEGKSQTLSLGAYPTISLVEARKALLELKIKLKQGINPCAEKQAVKTEHKYTLENIALEWIDKNRDVWSKKHLDTTLSRLQVNVFPFLGKKYINNITAPELLECLRKAEARGVNETAHRALSICGQIFRYAIATGQAERDISQDLKGALAPVKRKNFASITDEKEIGLLLNTLDRYAGGVVVKIALQIAPYVFVRPSELRCATWTEFDLVKSEWRIPAERMKMKELHIVPLSRQVVSLLEELYQYTGHTSFLFPGNGKSTGSISDATLLVGLRRMGYAIGEMTVHGFRSMASTLLNEQGYNRDHIERQLAHSERNGVRGAYNYAEYLPERRIMMQEWADYLDSLK